MNGGYWVSNGSADVMRLSQIAYGALYQAAFVERVLELVALGDVKYARTVVGDAMSLADSLSCPHCELLGLHEECWAP